MVQAFFLKIFVLLPMGIHALPEMLEQSGAVRKPLDPKRIVCPVLAAMWRNADLKTDELGDVELDVMIEGLENGIGSGWSLAKSQGFGITDFDRANKGTELVRDRCIPGFTLTGTKCWAKREAGSKADDTKRWFNIFTMNGKQVLEHGISTGVRGGATNVPDPETCGGIFPCEDRFQRFYASSADSNGRLYRSNLMKVVCAARKMGDRGGEYSYSSGSIHLPGSGDLLPVPAREWQMKAALSGWLNAFGRRDDRGELYLTVDDARAMLMEGRYPDGFQKRPWGCLTTGCEFSFLHDANQPVECDIGETDPWWQEADCKVAAGSTCWFSCDGGATCVEGQCICGRASNGMGMCWKDGKCVERPNTCKYFGEGCQFVPATNPPASGNPAVVTNTTLTYV